MPAKCGNFEEIKKYARPFGNQGQLLYKPSQRGRGLEAVFENKRERLQDSENVPGGPSDIGWISTDLMNFLLGKTP